MMEDNYAKAYKEIVEILKYVPEENVNKIPKEMRDMFEAEQLKTYNFQIDTEKTFEEQELLEETKAILDNIFSLLPAIASYIYLFILLSKNMKLVRKSTVALRLLWAVYDFIVKAYTTFVLDIFSFISSLIAIYRLDIKKQK